MRSLKSVGWTLFLIGVPMLSHPQRAAAQDNRPEAGSFRATGLLGFERRQFRVERVRGKVLLDGQLAADNVVEVNRREIRLIQVFDGHHFKNTGEFQSWARKLRGARTYTYDLAHWTEPDGTVHEQPIVLLPEQERKAAEVLWRQWRADEDAAEAAALAAAEERRIAFQRNKALERLIQQQGETIARLAASQAERRSTPRRAYAVAVIPGSTVDSQTGIAFGSSPVLSSGILNVTVAPSFGNQLVLQANGLSRAFATSVLTR
ncbi:MAG: hypothetical protein AAGD07_13490 [Planctomycetota bacterium]